MKSSSKMWKVLIGALVVLSLVLVPAEQIRAETGPTFVSATFFGGSGNQYGGNDAVESAGGGIAIAGGSVFLGGITGVLETGEYDGVVVSYALPPGLPQWSHTWPGFSGPDLFNAIAVSGEGAYVAGYSYSQTVDYLGGKEVKGIVVKYPLGGTSPLWVAKPKFFPYPPGYDGDERLHAVATLVQGESTFIYATGFAQPHGASTIFVIAKFDASGNVLAKATDSIYSGPGYRWSFGSAMTVLNGKIYVAGQSNVEDGGSLKPALWKYDPGLNLEWKKRDISFPAGAAFKGVTALGNAIYAVGGVYSSGNWQYLIQKYDESGNQLWSQTSGGAGDDFLNGVVAIGSRLFAVGYTKSQGAGGQDAVILEIDPQTGNTLSTTLWGGAQNDRATAAATDGAELYVVGDSKSFAQGGNVVGQSDIVVLRYSLAVPNQVWTDFRTRWEYRQPGDSFTNTEVTGAEDWLSELRNFPPDGTGQPVTNVLLSLSSNLTFDRVSPVPTTMGPPTYQWSFGNVPENPFARSAAVGFNSNPVTFIPGFNASRSASQKVFSENGTQTLTISFTPLEGMRGYGVGVSAPEDDKVNPVITAATTNGTETITLFPDGHRLDIRMANPQVGVTYTSTITIRVTPKVPVVEFMPRVAVASVATAPYASGFTTGSSVTHDVPDMGTWTWSANGIYRWNWASQLVKGVIFRGYANNTPAGNGIVVQDQASGVSITFDNVTAGGDTTVTTSGTGPPPPTGFKLGSPPTYYNIQTTAATAPGSPITVCINYDETQFNGPEANLTLFHRENDQFIDVTSSLDTTNNIICGQVTSLSLFVIAKQNTTPNINSFTADPAVQQAGGTVNFLATFTDPDLDDTHTATFTFGDTQTGVGTITNRTVTAAHAYAQAGVYTATLTISDGMGGVTTTSLLVAVYDPSAGFVTGGGWIESPLGAYVANPSLTGKAILGFVSKYQKGATVPTGQTQFQFRVASLNFHSDSYEWLVVAGARAQYKGVGTINGTGSYGFMLTAIDGQVSGGGGVDKFRIKIWDKATDAIIYDNQIGKSDSGNDATQLGGGSIVIHN